MKQLLSRVQARRYSYQPTLRFGLLCLIFSFTIAQAHSQNFKQVFKGIAPNRASSDEFGTVASISGDYAVVGAPKEDEDAADANTLSGAGSAYIYKRDTGGNWSFHQKIVAFDRQLNDQFGVSVSIAGDYLIIGAVSSDSSPGTNLNTNEGAAYIYERNTTTNLWEYKIKLVAPVRNTSDQFGVSVNITSGGYAVVGANAEDEDAAETNFVEGAGSAYIFERNNATTNWDFKQKVVASDRDDFDQFGVSVNLSGNYLIVGARNKDATTNDAENFGAAYVYERDGGGTWSQVAILTAPTADRSASDQFGTSVAIDGNWLVVGANFDDEKDDTGTDPAPEGNAGSAYIFNRNGGGTWTYKQKIVANDRLGNDNFGGNVSISGSNILISALAEDEDENGANNLNNSGSAYIFHLNTNNQWVQAKKLVADDRELNALFGSSVAISGDDLIVGARRKDEDSGTTTDAGAMYILKNNIFNAGLLFDGGDDYVVLPNESNFDVTNAFTLETWVKFTGTLSNGVYKSIVTKGNEAWKLRFKGTASNVVIAFDYNGSNELVSDESADFKTGGWHHVAITFDGISATKKLTIYIDGVQNATATPTADISPNDDPVWVGNNVDDNTNFLLGAIDELRLWKRVKTSTEINGFKSCQLTGTEACLIAYYNCNEGLPLADNSFLTELKDITGNNNGTLTGFGLASNTPTSNFLDADTGLTRSGTCSGSILLPQMDILGNGVSITNGSTSPLTSNNTDFGSVVLGNSITKTFKIKNNGTATLNLLNATGNYVSISGGTGFSISQPSGGNVATSNETTFQVTFSPTTATTSSAIITILSDDCSNSTYTFALSGTGTPASSEIDIKETANNHSIASQSSFSMSNYTIGNNALIHSFTIRNTASNAALNLTAPAPNYVTLSGDAGFSISTQPSTASINGGDSTTFVVSFSTTTTGTKTTTLTVLNSDADESTYTITLTVVAAPASTPEIAVAYLGKEIASGDTLTVDTTAALNTRSINIAIKNPGAASLHLSGTPPVEFKDTNNSGFSVTTTATASTIAVNDSTTFTLNFSPVTLGTKFAQLTISSDDADEGTYIIYLKSEAVEPPNPPADVKIESASLSSDPNATSGNALTLTWQAPSNVANITGYRVKRSDKDANAFVQVAELALTNTSFLDKDLTEGVQYYYRVYSYNQFGESEPGQMSSLIYVGLEETQRFANQTMVFPNPVQTATKVRFPSVNAATALTKIYTAHGQLLKILHTGINNKTTTIDMAGMPQGKYILQISVGNFLIYKQVIKQ